MKMNRSCEVQTPRAFDLRVPLLLRILNSWCICKLPIGHSGVHSQQEQLSKAAANCGGVNPNPAPKNEGEGIGSWVRESIPQHARTLRHAPSLDHGLRTVRLENGRGGAGRGGGALGWGGERRRRRHFGVPVKLAPLGSDSKRRS